MSTIPLTRGLVAIVDDEDVADLTDVRWLAVRGGGGNWYAMRWRGSKSRGTKRHEYMHRVLTGARPGQEVDHINGDGLDNRRANLRLTDHTGNARNCKVVRKNNSSGFKGVYWHQKPRRWVAVIFVQSKRIHLGSFTDKQEAARVYDAAARRLFGAFARPNFEEAQS